MATDSKKVSIIIPAYNAAEYIGFTIESVLKQTHENWEAIIIDDCSKDATAAVVERYAERDGRIRFYRNEQNMGVARTRNRGFDLAQGEWVALLDSDDCWYSEKIEKQLRLAVEKEADIVYSSYALVNVSTGERKSYVVRDSTDYNSMLNENVIGCSTVMLRKSITDTYQFSTQFAHEDYALWLELLKAGYKAVGCKEILVDYAVMEGSRSYDKRKAAINRWKILRKGQKLPLYRAVPAFCVYAIRGVIKHR